MISFLNAIDYVQYLIYIWYPRQNIFKTLCSSFGVHFELHVSVIFCLATKDYGKSMTFTMCSYLTLSALIGRNKQRLYPSKFRHCSPKVSLLYYYLSFNTLSIESFLTDTLWQIWIEHLLVRVGSIYSQWKRIIINQKCSIYHLKCSLSLALSLSHTHTYQYHTLHFPGWVPKIKTDGPF